MKTRIMYRYTGAEKIFGGYRLLPGRFISEGLYMLLPPEETMRHEIRVGVP